MTARLLPVDEYPRLVGTELEGVWRSLPPQARVVVVEEAGRIVGTWALFACWHVEGCWVAQEHRKRGVVAGALLEVMRQTARQEGCATVVTGALTEEVKRLIEHLGGWPLPGDHFVLPIGGGV